MKKLWWLLAGAMLAQKFWKHWLVWRFFRRPIPPGAQEPRRVSILQPILSGDPALAECLRANLTERSRYRLEFIWLIDSDDPTAQTVCRELAAAGGHHPVRVVTLPPPRQHDNPKTIKLIAGLAHARGDVICVLDDDTRLPDRGLEQCLPFLDQPEVGLAFGLPYYGHFGNLWSSLVSLFVNDQSLMTYIPYTALAEPFTINGMFFAIRREVLDQIGGFAGLEGLLADDFAIATRVRQHGYRLAQTPLRHAISTHIRGPRHYLGLLQRWFIFPRESLLRYLTPRELALTYGLVLVPTFAPLVLLLLVLRRRALWPLLALYLGYDYALFAHINRAYLGGATPWRHSWWVPLLDLLLPLQLLVALLSPQRINWRGHIMQVEPGGGFRFVKRRGASGGEPDTQL